MGFCANQVRAEQRPMLFERTGSFWGARERTLAAT